MSRPRRIYDSFLFDGELDLLEFRLRQNYDDTDYFLLVEAGETYRGQSKPLQFAENRQRFAWASDKIIPIELKVLGTTSSTPRDRAAVQRNTILLALIDALPEDILLLLDADEVPSLSLLRRLRLQEIHEPHRLEMTRHYQSLNVLAPASTCCIDQTQPFSFAAERIPLDVWNTLPARWSGRSGVAAPVGILRQSGYLPYDLRYSGRIELVLKDAGRHLTAADPSASLARKLGRVFHAEWATDRGMYPPHLTRCQDHAVHHRGWWYAEQVPGPLPEDLQPLAAACPGILRSGPMPSMTRRRLVRTWAWLRQWPTLPDAFVRSIDDRFEQLLPLLFVPLLTADLARFVAAKVWTGKAKTSLDEHASH